MLWLPIATPIRPTPNKTRSQFDFGRWFGMANRRHRQLTDGAHVHVSTLLPSGLYRRRRLRRSPLPTALLLPAQCAIRSRAYHFCPAKPPNYNKVALPMDHRRSGIELSLSPCPEGTIVTYSISRQYSQPNPLGQELRTTIRALLLKCYAKRKCNAWGFSGI